ncbi:hypothetical protein [Aquibacillus rhizosphaerae]|uniref:Uncharacterized protein n=1 Tax=Aquibacillus rhizosphaerae TaxID=3051431 RepID=A0ABT7LAC6_9BACI|nr:hypothetical protein [Aquibacillus sp. LR5S19]MDL4842820.1 hypothetical protein [Aquibacillus sp. LR5S19]
MDKNQLVDGIIVFMEKGITIEEAMKEITQESVESFRPRFCWKVSEYRKDKRTGVMKSIERSNYAQVLFDKGAGFNE